MDMIDSIKIRLQAGGAIQHDKADPCGVDVDPGSFPAETNRLKTNVVQVGTHCTYVILLCTVLYLPSAYIIQFKMTHTLFLLHKMFGLQRK